jgi:hypothetical protein
MNQAATDFPALERTLGREQGLGVLHGLPSSDSALPPEHLGEERDAWFLLVEDVSSRLGMLAGHFGDRGLVALQRRVAIAAGQRRSMLWFGTRAARQCGYLASGWRKPTNRRTSEEFVREREYVGRVRDVDREKGTFTAILGRQPDDSEGEFVVTFSQRLLDSKQIDRLGPGVIFTLVTGYRRTVDVSGRVVKTALDSRVFLHEPRTLTPAQREDARRLADRLFDNE